MKSPELSVVIVNFRTPDLVRQCLSSLRAERDTCSLDVVVVDNASMDGSAEKIEKDISDEQYHQWVRLVRSEENLGFSGGNNLGLTFVADSMAFLLLNSDTIVNPGCLSHCLTILKQDKSIGALSCKLLNADGSIQNTARRFPNPVFQILSSVGLTYRWPRLFGWANIQDPGWNRDTESRAVDWLGGAFLMIPRNVMNVVGPLDEDFFFYGEDVELCHRIKRAGFTRWYEAGASTIHFGAGSSDVTRLPASKQNKHRWNARYLEQRKLYGLWAEWVLRFVDIVMKFLRTVKVRLFGRSAV